MIVLLAVLIALTIATIIATSILKVLDWVIDGDVARVWDLFCVWMVKPRSLRKKEKAKPLNALLKKKIDETRSSMLKRFEQNLFDTSGIKGLSATSVIEDDAIYWPTVTKTMKEIKEDQQYNWKQITDSIIKNDGLDWKEEKDFAKKAAEDAYDKTFGKGGSVDKMAGDYAWMQATTTTDGSIGFTMVNPYDYDLRVGSDGNEEKEDELCLCSKNLWK